jgi:hypothetical protein
MIRAALLALLVLTFVAPAAAEKPDPCARFEEPLAYNACLAAHGPRAFGARPEGSGEEGGPPRRHVPHERQRMELNGD